MSVITKARLEAASQGYRALFVKAFGAATPDWNKLAMKTTSTGSAETYEWLTGLPQMRKMVGEATLRNIATAGFTIKNEEFEATVPVKRSTIERDNLGLVGPAMSEMGRNAAFHPDDLVTDLLNKSFSPTNGKDYTGKAFFAEDKKYNPAQTAGTIRKFTNLSDAVFDEAGINAARTNIRTRTDSEGNNLKLGNRLLIVVPPALEAAAIKFRDAKEIGGTSNTLQGTFDLLVLNGLTSETAWFAMDVTREVLPFIVQYEVEPEFIASTDPDSEHALFRKEFIYQVYDRKNAGYALPQFAFGSTGDAA